MSRPIDRFLFAEGHRVHSILSPLVFLAAKEEKKKFIHSLATRFARAAKGGGWISRFGEIEGEVLSRGNWIGNSRKGTMDRGPSRLLPSIPSSPPKCGEKRFDIRTGTVKLSLVLPSSGLVEWHLPRHCHGPNWAWIAAESSCCAILSRGLQKLIGRSAPSPGCTRL